MPFHLLDDLLLDLRYRDGPMVDGIVNEVPKLCVAAAAHAVSWLVASYTESLSSFNRSPFNPRLRAVQTSAQVMMLALLQGHLSPKYPKPSGLLGAINECYFSWLSVKVNPSKSGFEETQRIASEDVNVEHLTSSHPSTRTRMISGPVLV